MNPYSIGLTSEELEEFLLFQYNEITSLYHQYDSVALTEIIEDLWDNWVKDHRPDIFNALTQKKMGEDNNG